MARLHLPFGLFLTVVTVSWLAVESVHAQCGAPAPPDLIVLQTTMSGWTIVSKPGGGYEIRFSTGVGNAGMGPLHLYAGATYPDDATQDVWQRVMAQCDGVPTDRLVGRFEHHPGHNHFHIERFARYRLRVRPANNSVGPVVAQSDYTSFCILDVARYNSTLPGSPAVRVYSFCGAATQGISVGWNDVQSSGLSGQSIDLACVGNGNYWLEQEVDPDNQILEMNETNNVTRIAITISSLPGPTGVYCPNPAGVAILMSPDTVVATASAPSDSLRARVWFSGVTEGGSPSAAITAELGYGPDGSHAETGAGWTWASATYRQGLGADDVYTGTLTIPTTGLYDFAFRFRNAAGPWIYADLDGTLNGFSPTRAGSIDVEAPVGVEPRVGAGVSFRLREAPARGTARLDLSLPKDDAVEVVVFDAMGRRVRALFRGPLSAGAHALPWDMRDDARGFVKPGVYHARLTTASGFQRTARVPILR
jgi:hypothetical protein